MLRDIEGAIDKGARPGRFTFDAAAQLVIDDYIANNKRSLGELKRRLDLHILPIFKGRRLSDITTQHVIDYQAVRTKERASNGTINRECAIISRAFRLANRAGHILNKPYIPRRQEAEPREGFFSDEELKLIVAKLPKHLRRIATFQHVTGWRIREVLGLTWDRVTDDEVRLEARHTKGKMPRTFPITNELAAVLKPRRKAGPVFPDPETAEAVEYWSYRYWWGKARGDSRRIPHDLRRPAVRNMVRRGIPERVAMQLTGHKTRAVFERYNIVSESDLSDARAKLDGFTASVTASKRRIPRNKRVA